MEDQRLAEEAQAKQEAEQAKLEAASCASILITDNPDNPGNVIIECKHTGDFDPTLKSHRMLRAISQFLPQFAAEEAGEITDGERYRALLALSRVGEQDAQQAIEITQLLMADLPASPDTAAGFAEYVDRLVRLIRNKGQIQPQAQQPEVETAEILQLRKPPIITQ